MSFKSSFGGLVQYMQYLEEAKNKSYDELMETINACDPDNLDRDQHSFEDAFEMVSARQQPRARYLEEWEDYRRKQNE